MAIGTIGHWFKFRRGFATGLASRAGSLGRRLLQPLALLPLHHEPDSPGATRGARCSAFLFPRRRRKPADPDPGCPEKPKSRGATLLPDTPPRIFKDRDLGPSWTAALFLDRVGVSLFCGLSYTAFVCAVRRACGRALAYRAPRDNSTRGCSFFGRLGARGLLADRIGRFNTMILHGFPCAWLRRLRSGSRPALTGSPGCKGGIDHDFCVGVWLCVWE